MASDKKDFKMMTQAKQVSRTLLLTALLVGGLLGATGCDELLGDGDYGYGGYSSYDDYGWYDGGGGNDGFYSNWYTDTTINGDDSGFYIAGDGFTYTSGW